MYNYYLYDLYTQPEEFMNSTEEQRVALKHSLQLERFKVYFKVGSSSVFKSTIFLHTLHHKPY